MVYSLSHCDKLTALNCIRVCQLALKFCGWHRERQNIAILTIILNYHNQVTLSADWICCRYRGIAGASFWTTMASLIQIGVGVAAAAFLVRS